MAVDGGVGLNVVCLQPSWKNTGRTPKSLHVTTWGKPYTCIDTLHCFPARFHARKTFAIFSFLMSAEAQVVRLSLHLLFLGLSPPATYCCTKALCQAVNYVVVPQ